MHVNMGAQHSQLDAMARINVSSNLISLEGQWETDKINEWLVESKQQYVTIRSPEQRGIRLGRIGLRCLTDWGFIPGTLIKNVEVSNRLRMHVEHLLGFDMWLSIIVHVFPLDICSSPTVVNEFLTSFTQLIHNLELRIYDYKLSST